MIGDTVFKTVENTARFSIVYALLAVLFLLNIVSWPFVPDSIFKPYLILIAVYYWAIYRPTLIPAPLCFFAGLIYDLITGVPPGLFAGLFVLTFWVVRNQRRFLMGQTYIATWFIFILVALTVSLTEWLMTGLVNMSWGLPVSWIVKAGLTGFLFPFISILLIYAHRTLPVASGGPA